jgi:hypothetical protein
MTVYPSRLRVRIISAILFDPDRIASTVKALSPEWQKGFPAKDLILAFGWR